MRYDFGRLLDRRGTASLKCDFCELEHGLENVIPMWVADMDLPSPAPVAEAIRRRAEHPAYGYTLFPESYWEAIAGWLKARLGWEIRREWLSGSPGVVPALNFCVRAFSRPGGKVLIQPPVYRPFSTAVEGNGRRLVRNPLRFEGDRIFMDLEGLEAAIDGETRVILLCNPHNPVGRVWTREELEGLGEICVRRDLIVVSDEIHSDLVFDGRKHVPAMTVSAALADRTIALMAPSKTFNLAGLATSFVVASNPDLLKAFESEVRGVGLFMGNVFGIVALEAAYRHGAEWLDQLLPYLEGNIAFAAEFFRTRVPRIRFRAPEGTYLALLDCRALGLPQTDLDDFFLRKAGVLFDKGTLFGPELEGFERMNFACSRPVLREALERIARAVDAL
jgi:cysteine-S-conjugate beta-lyase